MCIIIMYKLRDWIDEKRLTNALSCNERAIEYLENHEDLMDDTWIFRNEHAIHIIEKRIEYDKCGYVNYNKNAVNFLRNYPQYIDYAILCSQEHGVEFVDELIKNNELEKINWRALSENPAAMHILNDPKYYEFINWWRLVYNKNAGNLIKNNLHKVIRYHWHDICTQPHLIDIIEEHEDSIVWLDLSENYNAIHLLEKNLDKIYNIFVCRNKHGFELLLKLHHNFSMEEHRFLYDKHIIFDYFDYCEKNNIPFNLIKQLSVYGYTEKHMEFLQHNHYYPYLSMNPNIFEYDYKRMRETRQSLLWYNDIKK